MATEKETPEVLQRLHALQERLHALGVSTPEQLAEVQAIVLEQTNLQSDLVAWRENQFYDDASDLHYKQSGQRYNKIEINAAFLRRFAEHVAMHTVSLGCPGNIDDLVDQIPVMTVKDRWEKSTDATR